MSSYNNSGLFAPGTGAYKYTENDWALHGKAIAEPFYEGNFEEDIDAIAESVADSGYYSNDTESSEEKIYDTAPYADVTPPTNLEAKTADSSHLNFCVDVVASNKSIHGSNCDSAPNKSTTYLDKGSSFVKQSKENRMSKTVYQTVHEYEHKTAHKYSSVKVEEGDQQPLEAWKTTPERHEWIAYQLEQSSNAGTTKRRRISKK